MTQDYADAVRAAMQAAIADYSHCLLCGRPCASVALYGVRLRVCPCVEQFPGRPAMVGINLGGLMEPKLTIEDLAVAASEAYQHAEQKDRWTAVAIGLIEKISNTLPVKLAIHSDGEVTIDVTREPDQADA